jgi:hypothetical protein
VTGRGRPPGRCWARVLPAEIRDWAVAVWAEADEAPSAPGRLAWLAGGAWVVARGSFMIVRVRHAVLFGASAALLAWIASAEATSFDSAEVWCLAVTTILVLAGLPRLLRRRLGPVTDSRVAHGLRATAYAAIFILIVALVAMEHSKTAPGPHSSEVASLALWSPFLLILVGYVAVILMVTARRSQVTSVALAIGTSAGLALGAVMYAIMPLGVGKDATAPWLRGSAIDPLVVLAWVLLLGGPVAAAVLAGWLGRCAEATLPAVDMKIRQSVAAGLLATTVGSLVVCVLGPVTIALLPRSGVLARVLYPGQHLTAAVIAGRAHYLASNGAPGYFLIWLFFPVIGIALGSWTGLTAWLRGRTARPGNGPEGGGGPGDGDRPPTAGGYAGEPGDEQASVAVGAFVSVRG